MSILGEIERSQTSVVAAAGRGVLRFLTAGSVDDGKSTLIGRLLHDTRALAEDQVATLARASRERGRSGLDLSLVTDGLEAERAQGITIDVAYRYFATPRRKFIIADAPGHEQYTRNMVTAASTADAAVILVDVSKGVLTQTRRHAFIAHLLGLHRLVFAVNKMDLAGYSRDSFERVRDEIVALAARIGASEVGVVPVSALCGAGVVERGIDLGWYAGPTLLEALEAIEPRREATALPLRFPVQFVIRSDGVRRYAGRVASGVLAPGKEVFLPASGAFTTVREVGTFDGPRTHADAGDSVAVTLADELDVGRGDLLVDAAQQPRAARALDATVCWLGAAPLVPGARLAIRHLASTVRARVVAIADRVDVNTLARVADPGLLAMNDVGRVTLMLQRPLAVDPYAHNRATGAFVLIDETTNQTVAAGLVE
jgi:sulfate adenylyltransferase large subunit